MSQAAGSDDAAPDRGPGAATRERILRCAEQLFAREGIDRTTLRQIVRAAEQRNVAAVQYHFGSKEGLLREIVDGHQRDVDEARREQLAELGHEADLVDLLRVLVEPLAAKLDDARGRDYLQIQTQRREPDPFLPATRELADRIETVLAPGEPRALRNQFVVLLLFHALAERARAETSEGPVEPDRPHFVAELIAALHGIYAGAVTPA